MAAGGILDTLHPGLRSYFSAIPDGQHGYGTGIFSAVGTPRQWLLPFLRVLVPGDVMFAVWERNVPFTVVNRPAADDRGRIVVRGARRFHFSTGDRTMVDAITAEPEGLVDHLGARRRFSAHLEARAVDGALLLDSAAVSLRVGRVRFRLPRPLAPRIALSERIDDTTGEQKVAVTIDLPILGRVYEYAGSFRYEIRQGEGPAWANASS
ncbi:MAG TPA: DUF4166 domain-containing protein [Glaciibacter sp.]|nr:DUF4166 domain-containing protein [Glaciibacter sp.]